MQGFLNSKNNAVKRICTYLLKIIDHFKNYFMQTQIKKQLLYNLLFSGTISLEEYLKEMNVIKYSENK